MTQAERTQNIYNNIIEIENFWKEGILEMVPFKDSNEIYLLTSNDEVMAKCDDYLMMLKKMESSRYAVQFIQKIQNQIQFINYFQELIDSWF